MRLALVTDAPPLPEADAPAPDAPTPDAEAGTHRWRLLREGVWTGDGRRLVSGSTTWRDLPLPFMATDVTDEGHDGAVLIAQIVEIERVGDDIFAVTRDVVSDSPDVQRLQKLINDGVLDGVSVDLDNVEGNLLIAAEDAEFDPEAEPEVNADGEIVIKMSDPKMEVTSSRVMGATAVPFPAFAEARLIAAAGSLDDGTLTFTTAQAPDAFGIEDDARALHDAIEELDDPALLDALLRLIAEAEVDMAEPPPTDVPPAPEAQPEGAAIVAAVNAPDAPPVAWMRDPKLTEGTPLTVTDEGRLFGHVALWKSCHRGYATCTPPPRAPAGSYSHFHTGTVICDDGTRVSVGNITVDSGHAELASNARLAKQHYDHTGWVGADVVCGEDEFGIWMAGSVRPDLTPLALRKLMACDVSGDWRSIDGKLQLIGLASVPVPGFVKTHVASGMVASLVASVPVCDTPTSKAATVQWLAVADRIAAGIGRSREHRLAERDAVAFQLGRHPSQRRAALAARVKG